MPLDHGAGHSEDTAVKQRDFGYVLGTLLKVANAVMQRDYAHKEFLYFDLNAGPGVVGGVEGSPLIFARMAATLGLPFRAFLFEEDDENARRLSDALRDVCAEHGADVRRLQIIPGDHNKSVPWFIQEHLASLPSRWTYGLGYGDGNGKTDAPFGPMAALAARFPRVDLLLNVNATIYKRLRGANPSAGFLLDDLSVIKKAQRLIREPVGIHQWTMVFQTNWDRPPEFGEIGFRRLDSDEGRRIAGTVNFSKPERRGRGQLRLAFEDGRPTAPMPSTSDTPVSVPCAPLPSHGATASASIAGSPARPSPTM